MGPVEFFLLFRSFHEMLVVWQEHCLWCPRKHPSLHKSLYKLAVVLAWEELLARYWPAEITTHCNPNYKVMLFLKYFRSQCFLIRAPKEILSDTIITFWNLQDFILFSLLTSDRHLDNRVSIWKPLSKLVAALAVCAVADLSMTFGLLLSFCYGTQQHHRIFYLSTAGY